ncbi:MAG: hypothetical protein ACFE9T_07005 [Promethearchaeota archaeon]
MSPRPGPMRRRMIRRAVRRPVRRGVRRARRVFWRNSRRLLLGTSVILLIGGSYGIYKLSQRDVQKIEEETGKSTDDMTEEELKATMRKLGIQKLEITPEDEDTINKVYVEDSNYKIKQYCIYCGARLDRDNKYCPSCGQKV